MGKWTGRTRRTGTWLDELRRQITADPKLRAVGEKEFAKLKRVAARTGKRGTPSKERA